MDTIKTTQQPELTGKVLFYRDPQPLSAEQHGGLGVNRLTQPFGFLRTAHAIPITVTEFGLTTSSYPIIFVGDDFTPVAIMGVRPNQNLFVNDQGRIDPDFYIPAFVRRYPFVFANENSSDRLLLCVDRGAEMVSNQPDIPFFKDGQPTDYTENAIEFCKEFERQRRATLEFIDILKQLDLFEQKSVSFQPRDTQGEPVGERQKIADYWAISEKKLAALSEEKFMELRGKGMLGAIHAHILSLLNWNRIIQRAMVATPRVADVPGANGKAS